MFLAAVASLSAGALAVPSPAVAGTACCAKIGDCTTVSGTTDGGLHWCYGYHGGGIEFSNDDGKVAQCLTDLHYKQNSACITTKGSSCDTGIGPDVVSAHESRLYGNHQLSSDDSLAIQAAIGAAVANGLKWSDDTTKGPGYILFSRVADNGSGIRGMEIYNRNLC